MSKRGDIITNYELKITNDYGYEVSDPEPVTEHRTHIAIPETLRQPHHCLRKKQLIARELFPKQNGGNQL